MRKLNKILILLLIYACSSNWEGVESLGLVSTRILLQENIRSTSPLISFDLLQDGSIIGINQNQELIRYSSIGEQVEIFSNSGEGEFELSDPFLIESFSNGYLVWDRALLKMVEFDENNQPIKEYKGFDHAIKGFKVDQNYIYTYINPLPNESIIQVYDKKLNKISYRLGSASNSDIIANLNNCGGGMTFYQNSFVFIPSASFDVYKVDTSNIEKIELSLLDFPEINFKEVEQDPVGLINSERQKAFQMSMSSSIITGIFNLEENLLITGETGTATLNGSQLDVGDRKQFFLLLDDQLKAKRISYKEFDFNSPCKLWKDSHGSFYQIVKEEGDDEFKYYLEKLSL